MARDIIDEIQADHDEIRALFAQVEQAPPEEREDLVRHLVSVLARHEAAEESVVHPTLRDEFSGGDTIAEEILREESEAEQMLADLEGLDPAGEEFARLIRKLKLAVFTHASHEEEREHPRLRELDEGRRHDMGQAFDQIRDRAPTHPHPRTPQTPGVRAAAGPLVGMFDRARDAVRDATSR